MAFQIIVIGLGQFGMALANSLAQKGAGVIAVDSRKELVEEASAFASEAVCMNAASEPDLRSLEPEKRDAVVCAIGDEAKEASIICTALLRQMGVRKIIARAHDPVHQRIMYLVGAHKVINPELESGKRFANQLLLNGDLLVSDSFSSMQLIEIVPLPFMVGKTLLELGLPKKYGIIVAAVKKAHSNEIRVPDPALPLEESDKLLLVGSEGTVNALIKGDVR